MTKHLYPYRLSRYRMISCWKKKTIHTAINPITTTCGMTTVKNYILWRITLLNVQWVGTYNIYNNIIRISAEKYSIIISVRWDVIELKYNIVFYVRKWFRVPYSITSTHIICIYMFVIVFPNFSGPDGRYRSSLDCKISDSHSYVYNNAIHFFSCIYNIYTYNLILYVCCLMHNRLYTHTFLSSFRTRNVNRI